MYITKLHIDAFGTLREREIELSPGLNIIEGVNESGKSATAMFIKFMLYGLSGKATGGELTERRRYVNWDTGTAAGSMTVFADGLELRIERSLLVTRTEDGGKGREATRETVRMIDTATNTIVHRGEVPGEVLCGVPENIFLNTVFVRQIDGTQVNNTGMLTSIENLLFTANETVSTKKAIERLDEARRQILHKNGGGGLLGELRAKRSEAAEALKEAQDASGTLVGAEGEFAEAKRLCEELTAKTKRQEIICRYGAINLAKRRFDTVAAAQKKLTEMHKELAAADDRCIDRALLAQLRQAEKNLNGASETTQKLTAAQKEAAARLKAASKAASEKEQETEDALALASSLQMRTKSMMAAGIALLFFAIVVGVVGAGLLYAFSVDLYMAPLLLAIVLLALSVLCFILRGRAAKRLREKLSEWGALNLNAIPTAIAQNHLDAENPDTVRAEKQRLDAALSEAITAQRETAEAAFALAARIDESANEKKASSEDDLELTDNALIALAEAVKLGEAHCESVEALRREADTLSGRLSLLREQLAGEDEAAIRAAFAENMQTVEGRIASGIDAARLETAQKQYEALKASLADAQEKMHRLETGIVAARAVTASPIEITDKITEMDAQIEELTVRHEAYCLAIDTLRDASDTMRASVLPKVVSEACASVNRLSGGAFDSIGVDQQLSMTFTRRGQTRAVDYLSEGTKDIAYISLRRALTGVLFGGKRPPLIYDESFARVDEARLTRVLTLLSSPEESTTQSILLTCRKLEGDIAAITGGAHIVKL